MKYLASILLLICNLALGTGALEYAHNLQHAADDAREDAALSAAGQPLERHQHDDSNCSVHLRLHLAFFFDSTVLFAVLLGLLVAFLRLLDDRQIPHLLPLRIGCRGPPAGFALL